jgi:predicted PurR-regulated permease PerM
MAKIVSFVTLVVVLLVIGGLFLRVMAGFLLPLFLALLLVIVFGPMHRWFVGRCGRHYRIAALLATVSILAVVLVPLAVLLLAAGCEAQSLYLAAMDTSAFAEEAVTNAPAAPSLTTMVDRGADELVRLGKRLKINLDREELRSNLDDDVRRFLAPMALRTTQFLGQMLLSLLVMILGVYYFFADGPAMIQTLLRLSPLEVGYTRELIGQFDNVTRAVVAATLLSAFVQGLLVGVGFTWRASGRRCSC